MLSSVVPIDALDPHNRWIGFVRLRRSTRCKHLASTPCGAVERVLGARDFARMQSVRAQALDGQPPSSVPPTEDNAGNRLGTPSSVSTSRLRRACTTLPRSSRCGGTLQAQCQLPTAAVEQYPHLRGVAMRPCHMMEQPELKGDEMPPLCCARRPTPAPVPTSSLGSRLRRSAPNRGDRRSGLQAAPARPPSRPPAEAPRADPKTLPKRCRRASRNPYRQTRPERGSMAWA